MTIQTVTKNLLKTPYILNVTLNFCNGDFFVKTKQNNITYIIITMC